MPDIVKILYNGVDAFSPQPTPLIALDYSDIYYSEIWAQQETVTLQGQLTGCTFSDIVTAQRDLLNKFNKSFQTLEIWQQTGNISGRIYQKDFVEIRNIAFPSDKMIGVLNYAINLTCYPSGLFSGAFGILEPSDTWAFEEQTNESLNAVHTISCRALNTSSGPSNSLVNARQWAFGRTGMNSFVQPIFISGVSSNNFCLLSQNENIDRFNGAYSYTEIYTNDLARTGYGVIRYQTAIDSGNNVITVNLQGTAEGCGRNLSGIREAFNRLDKTAIAVKQYQSAFNLTDLNPTPLNQSFNEDPFEAKIDFSYTYDNDNSPSVWFDYTVDCSVGVNGSITASIEGTVNARGGDVANKLSRTIPYADGINLYGLVLPFYNSFDVSSTFVALNPVPTVNGKGINQSDGTVQLNATFTNQIQASAVLDSFEYVMQFNPQVRKMDAQPKLDGLGNYSVVDLGYANRASLTINGSAVTNNIFGSSAGVSAIKNACFNLFAQYGRLSNAVLERNSVTESRLDERVLNFTFSWSFDSPITIGPSSVSVIGV